MSDDEVPSGASRYEVARLRQLVNTLAAEVESLRRDNALQASQLVALDAALERASDLESRLKVTEAVCDELRRAVRATDVALIAAARTRTERTGSCPLCPEWEIEGEHGKHCALRFDHE